MVILWLFSCFVDIYFYLVLCQRWGEGWKLLPAVGRSFASPTFSSPVLFLPLSGTLAQIIPEEKWHSLSVVLRQKLSPKLCHDPAASGGKALAWGTHAAPSSCNPRKKSESNLHLRLLLVWKMAQILACVWSFSVQPSLKVWLWMLFAFYTGQPLLLQINWKPPEAGRGSPPSWTAPFTGKLEGRVVNEEGRNELAVLGLGAKCFWCSMGRRCKKARSIAELQLLQR